MRARCPAHGSRGGTLSVRETSAGTVLLKCHAGCALEEILNAANLSKSDLFADRDRQRDRDRERSAARQRFARDPHSTIIEALNGELAKLRKTLRDELGYDPPLHAFHLNDARSRVRFELGLPEWTLPALQAREWECLPLSMDPAWPALFARALEQETRRRWHAMWPEANAWETDPNGPGYYDRVRAQELAASWLHAMAA
jgi:hypothetical protein